jgi:hypothetical protein
MIRAIRSWSPPVKNTPVALSRVDRTSGSFASSRVETARNVTSAAPNRRKAST